MGCRADPRRPLRPLTDEENGRLLGITWRTREPVNAPRNDRANVHIGPLGGRHRRISRLLRALHPRGLRHAQRGGFALDLKWSGGRPRPLSDAVRRDFRRIALSRALEVGEPFTTWSLAKLRGLLVDKQVIANVRLKGCGTHDAYGITFRATKTWRASPDADFEGKRNRILALYDDPPTDGRVVRTDEFDPLNLQPHIGRGWHRAGEPARLRATPALTRSATSSALSTRRAGSRSVAPAIASAAASSSPPSKPCGPALYKDAQPAGERAVRTKQ